MQYGDAENVGKIYKETNQMKTKIHPNFVIFLFKSCQVLQGHDNKFYCSTSLGIKEAFEVTDLCVLAHRTVKTFDECPEVANVY